MEKTVTNLLKRILPGVRSPLFIILLTATLILSIGLDKPFWGHHDWNGVYWGQVAKNFATNGPFFSKFAMYLNAGDYTSLNYNFHFLPTFTLIWALFFKLFGVFNWVSRIYAITFSLGSIVIFYKICQKFFSQKTANIATLFWISTPMFIYFGKMPVHEIPLMFFVLLSFWFYLNDEYRKTIFSTLGAMLITWPGFFLVPVFVLFKKKYWILVLIAVGLFITHLTHNFYVTGNFFGGGLKEIFLQRTAGANLSWYHWYFKTLASWSWLYYCLLIPLSFFGLFLRPNKIVFLLFFYAAIYPIVFRDASSRHDYLLIYFWPAICLSAALLIKHYLFAFLIILSGIYLRFDFLIALQNSNLYQKSVVIGEDVSSKTNVTDHVQIFSYDKSLPFDGWFANYYGDRSITYTTETSRLDSKSKTFYYFLDGKIIAGEETNNTGIK